jgi:hypothetical protein
VVSGQDFSNGPTGSAATREIPSEWRTREAALGGTALWLRPAGIEAVNSRAWRTERENIRCTALVPLELLGPWHFHFLLSLRTGPSFSWCLSPEGCCQRRCLLSGWIRPAHHQAAACRRGQEEMCQSSVPCAYLQKEGVEGEGRRRSWKEPLGLWPGPYQNMKQCIYASARDQIQNAIAVGV